MDTRYEPSTRGRGPLGTLYVLGLVTGVLAALIAIRLWPRDAYLEHYRSVRDFVRESFVREVSDQELLDHALHGMLSGLDSYSRYYDAQERAALDRETYGRYVGIGVVFRAPVAAGQVLFALPGSPAAEAGLEVGDTLLALDGRSVAEMGEAELRASLAEGGRSLALRVRGLDGAERELELRPAEVVDPTVRHVRRLDPQGQVGYISISSFTQETPGEFDRAFQFLQRRGARALVLDLRYNFGGVLDAAERIAQRFIPSGAIVSTEGRGRPLVTVADERAARYAGFPLIVLVDGDSASASEVLAGALQDHRRAVVVGTPTYGKGLVQTIRRFDSLRSVAKVTSSYYYSPAGRNFERTAHEDRDYGILPDVNLPLEAQTQQLVHRFLHRYGPPVEALAALAAWQEREGEPLVEQPPDDPQLAAALELFAGRRPGPQASLLDE